MSFWALMVVAMATLGTIGCRYLLARGHPPPSWTLANDALELTITRDTRGRLGMSRLRDLRTGYDWCRQETPSPLFQIAFVRGEQRVALSGRSAFDLLEQRQATGTDGTRTLRLRVRPRGHPLEIELSWRLHPGTSPIETWYTVANRGQEPITLTRLGTFSQLVEAGEEQTLWYVQKGTAIPGTLRVHQRPLSEGDSETLYCSPGESRDMLDAVPWFLLDRGQARGGLLFAWAFSAMGRFNITRAATTMVVAGGLQPDRFRHDLLAGNTLAAPTGLFGPYTGTPDDAARDWHRFLRRYWAPLPSDPLFPRLHYNTWYALDLNVDEPSCLRQLRPAADLGLELFHLDAGWYRAVGDWHADPLRFPHGLRPLAREAHRRGMKFGLWVAFTQISEELLRRHPDWITTPGGQIDPERPFPFRTLTICLGNPVAREWIRGELERIVQENDLDMLQYDQPIIEECPVPDHGHQSGDGGYAATLGLYELLDGLRRRFPHLILENCMDGGHIMDFDIARRTHFHSLTDYHDALRNRTTVYGATFPFLAATCEGYMADDPSLPPEYLFRSYMLGLWTNAGDVTSWNAKTRDVARRHIALYKRLRPLLRDGDVYHILPQANGRDWDGLEYYDPQRGEGVAFVFRPRSPVTRQRIPLLGLEDAIYEVRFEEEATGTRMSGPSLRQPGLEVELPQPHSAAVIHLKLVRDR